MLSADDGRTSIVYIEPEVPRNAVTTKDECTVATQDEKLCAPPRSDHLGHPREPCSLFIVIYSVARRVHVRRSIGRRAP